MIRVLVALGKTVDYTDLRSRRVLRYERGAVPTKRLFDKYYYRIKGMKFDDATCLPRIRKNEFKDGTGRSMGCVCVCVVFKSHSNADARQFRLENNDVNYAGFQRDALNADRSMFQKYVLYSKTAVSRRQQIALSAKNQFLF